MESEAWQDDQLEGAEPIAVYMRWLKPDGSANVRKVYYAAETKRWPITKLKDGQGSSRLISSKSALRRYRDGLIKEAEQEAGRSRIATTASA
jgi:hypothetical protein